MWQWRDANVGLIFVLNLATTTEKYGAVLILPSQSQSLIRQLVSYILFNDIHTSHATQKPENYEEILENLRFSIQSRKARLSEIRLRERRMTLLLTSYAFAAWALYLALWYTGWLPDVHGQHSTTPILRKAAFGAPVIIGPIVYVHTDMWRGVCYTGAS